MPCSATPVEAVHLTKSVDRCCLPHIRTSSASTNLFRGSMTRPACSLPTLRIHDRSCLRKARFRLVVSLRRAGLGTRGTLVEVSGQLMSILLCQACLAHPNQVRHSARNESRRHVRLASACDEPGWSHSSFFSRAAAGPLPFPSTAWPCPAQPRRAERQRSRRRWPGSDWTAASGRGRARTRAGSRSARSRPRSCRRGSCRGA